MLKISVKRWYVVFDQSYYLHGFYILKWDKGTRADVEYWATRQFGQYSFKVLTEVEWGKNWARGYLKKYNEVGREQLRSVDLIALQLNEEAQKKEIKDLNTPCEQLGLIEL